MPVSFSSTQKSDDSRQALNLITDEPLAFEISIKKILKRGITSFVCGAVLYTRDVLANSRSEMDTILPQNKFPTCQFF